MGWEPGSQIPDLWGLALVLMQPVILGSWEFTWSLGHMGRPGAKVSQEPWSIRAILDFRSMEPGWHWQRPGVGTGVCSEIGCSLHSSSSIWLGRVFLFVLGCLGLGKGNRDNVKLSFLPSLMYLFLLLCSTQVL